MCLAVRYIQILDKIPGVNDKEVNIFAVEGYAYATL